MSYWEYDPATQMRVEKEYQYSTEYWPANTFDPEIYAHVPTGKPEYRREKVRYLTGQTEKKGYYPCSNYKTFEFEYRDVQEQEILDTVFTKENASSGARSEQARVMEHYGYKGPVSGAEARALKNLMAELGLPNHVRRGHIIRTWTAPSIRRWRGEQTFSRLQACYVFKTPHPDIPFEKFIKLARCYRTDKGGIKAAVKAVLANPDASKEVETIDSIDILSKLFSS